LDLPGQHLAWPKPIKKVTLKGGIRYSGRPQCGQMVPNAAGEKLAPEQLKGLIRAGYVYRNGDEHVLTDKGRDALAQPGVYPQKSRLAERRASNMLASLLCARPGTLTFHVPPEGCGPRVCLLTEHSLNGNRRTRYDKARARHETFMRSLRCEVLRPPSLSDRVPKMRHVVETAPVRGSEPKRAPISKAKLEMPETDEAQFVSSGDGEEDATDKPSAELEGEEDAAEPDDAGLNGAALIEEIEGDEVEVTVIIEEDEEDE
jgi:hypothetical protein